MAQVPTNLKPTTAESLLADKRKETSKLNAEKARQRRQERQQKLKEMEQLEYETARTEFNQKLDAVVQPNFTKKKQQPVESDSDEEEFIVKFNSGKRKVDASDQFKKELEDMKKELEELRKLKEKDKEQVIQTPIVQQLPPQPKVIYVRPPNAELTNYMKQKILNF